MRHLYKTLFLIAILAFMTDCTTQKSRADRSALAKFYDNTTAKYNGYFNARELLRASILELEQQHEDNYNKILDLYEYVEVDNPQALAGNLDEAIKKVSVVVSLHRESVWTDDCYLLLGQAQYLKQDYEGAEETFRYMLEEYSPSKMKKREEASKNAKKVSSSKKKKSSSKKKKAGKKKKSGSNSKSAAQKRKEYNKNLKKKKKGKSTSPSKKKPSSSKKAKPKVAEEEKESDKSSSSGEEEVAEEEGPIGTIRLSNREEQVMEEKPQKYGVKHRPAYQEGVLWMARTLIERDNYDAAQRYIGQLDRSPATFKDIKTQLAAVEAYYYLSQKNYDQAIQPLKDAIELADRKDKARYAFIIGQIHQDAGRGDDAYTSFEQVLKYSPDFEMEFNSKLSLAQNAWLNGKGTAEEAKNNLAKMLKEEKNEEYKDQIYFALAEINLKNGNRPEAIKNFTLSLQTGRQSRTQKAEAYLKLGNLFMKDEDYLSAKYYYDSTLQVLPTTDDRHANVTKLSRSLTDIAQNLEILALQDSLIKISALSEEDKKKLAFEIKKQQDEERRKNIANKLNGGNSGNAKSSVATSRQLRPGSGPAALQKESSFFAYNDRAIKRGERDFSRKWGDRNLDDNWRRSNSRSGSDFDSEEEEVEEEVTNVLTDKDVKRLLGDVPSTEDEIAESHVKIREALFALGKLYRERLENYPKSIDALEQMNKRYPESTLELDSWYYLYLDFEDTNNPSQSKEYQDKILAKYPSSTYALIIKDPNYVVKIQDEEKRLNNYYDDAYDAFQKGKYKLAFDQSNSAKTEFGAANSLQPKFALLAAMSTGNLEGKDAYIKALNDVIAKYPSTPEQTRAREIIRLLGGGTGAILPGNKKATEQGYKVGEEQLHYIIISFDKDVSLTDSKAKVSDYNRKYHKLDKLRISNIYLGTEVRTPIIVIRRFKNKKKAMVYYNGVAKNSKDFLEKSTNYEIFAVTQNNYRQVLKNKTLEGYREFFEENYK